MKRVFLTVLDSVGAGAAPDAAEFGDEGTNTILSAYKTGILNVPSLIEMGIGNIDSLSFLGKNPAPTASCGILCEKSRGKDTTTGHWEISGIVSEKPFPTYPNGFPEEIISEFSRLTGRGVICNKPYSGTEVIKDYGDEHLKTGSLIVYTSVDSVFQVAAHEDIVPLEELYEDCRIARRLLSGEHAVGRVIARPFKGTSGNYTRTPFRRDFSLTPPRDTMLDAISRKKSVIAVGKITDIFASRGVTESILTHSNAEGIETVQKLLARDFEGLCFTNLVDFDTLYGHRNDSAGYARALNEFDASLPSFIEKMNEDDTLIITADHGCDPGYLSSTDHTRENIPVIIYSKSLSPKPLGVRHGFGNIAATVCALLDVDYSAGEEGYYDLLKG